nr:sporulation protein YunB [Paenibacillus beijingensis]
MAKWGRRSWFAFPIRPVRKMRLSGRRPLRTPAKQTRRWQSRPLRSGGSWTAGRRASKPGSRRKRWIIIIMLLFLAGAVESFIFVERNLRPPLMQVAKLRVKQIATQSINKAITDQVATESDFEKLIDWKTNNEGKVSGFMLNYAEHMKITTQTIDTVQSTLVNMKEITEHVPVGQALDSAILASFGPRMPVKFEPLGSVQVELNTRQKDAGINMILVEVYIHIKAEVAIIIPFDTEPEEVESEIPISYLLVVGDVPMYYYDGKGNPVGDSAAGAPALTLPPASMEGSGEIQPEAKKSGGDTPASAGTNPGAAGSAAGETQ